MNVLFVCSGNTCRSPMAEAFAQFAANQDIRYKDFLFESAGTNAFGGEAASREAAAVMREAGLDIEKHRAQRFSRQLSLWADIILAMEEKHIEKMKELAPGQQHKMHTLLGYSEGTAKDPGKKRYDIIDPFNRPIDAYRAARDEIMQAVDKALQRLSQTGKLV